MNKLITSDNEESFNLQLDRSIKDGWSVFSQHQVTNHISGSNSRLVYSVLMYKADPKPKENFETQEEKPRIEYGTGAADVIMERVKQLKKCGPDYDYARHSNGELRQAARELSKKVMSKKLGRPKTFDEAYWKVLSDKPHRERLVISASLLCAEIDRLDYGNKPDRSGISA